MPVYNCRSYIEECVSSVLNQTISDFEFIIIDDCSTDGTYEYLKSLLDKRINLIRKEVNTGYTVSLNMGLAIAKGDYIARMDGDDICVLDRFEKQLTFMDANPEFVLCGGAYQTIGSELRFIPKTSNDHLVLELMINSPFAHPTVLLRTSVLKNNNLKYNTSFEPAEDYKMWTILSEYGRLANLNDILLYYRIHPHQTTSRRGKSQTELAKLIAYEYNKKLSGDNENIDFFCKVKLKTIEDVRKYHDVESAIKLTLKIRGITVDENFFLERKKEYFRFSLMHSKHSIKQFFKDTRFILNYKSLLGSIFIAKHFVKSSISWKSE